MASSTGKETDPNRRTMLLPSGPLANCEAPIDAMRSCGRMFWERGWSTGTSSNYSVIVNRDPLQLVITASGKDKGNLSRHEFVRINEEGEPVLPNQPKSSAETLLHTVIAQEIPDAKCILHTHSVWSTVLSDLFFDQGALPIEGYEMLKGLEGVPTHEHQFHVDIFENTQDIPALSELVRKRLTDNTPMQHGFLIRKHGLYTWGTSVAQARRHVEIFEFLFECVARRLSLAAKV